AGTRLIVRTVAFLGTLADVVAAHRRTGARRRARRPAAERVVGPVTLFGTFTCVVSTIATDIGVGLFHRVVLVVQTRCGHVDGRAHGQQGGGGIRWTQGPFLVHRLGECRVVARREVRIFQCAVAGVAHRQIIRSTVPLLVLVVVLTLL